MVKSKYFVITVILIFFNFHSMNAQNELNVENKNDLKNTKSTGKLDIPQSSGDKVIFKDGGTTLLEIESLGSAGAIYFPNVGSNTSDYKLYRNANNLFWGSTQLNGSGGAASSLNDLSDAQHYESSLYLGFEAGGTNDDGGNNNTGVGFQSLYINTSGNYNVGNGYQSLYTNTIGKMNNAIGYQSLYSNQDGNNNVANGYQSLFANIDGDNNLANGHQALYANIDGNNNVANGYQALFANTDGRNNTANGSYALLNNLSGDNNTATGYRSLYANSGGSKNSSYGYQSQYLNLSGNNNTAIGYQSLYSNNSGVGNVMLGYQAGYNELASNKLYIENSNSSSPLIWGDFATNEVKINGNFHVTGDIITDGSIDGTIPSSSLGNLTDVNHTDGNLFIGEGAGDNYTLTPVGKTNTAVGIDALNTTSASRGNTAVGNSALKFNTSGDDNTAIGDISMRDNTSGNANTAIGSFSLYLNTIGIGNVALGTHALERNISGSYNTGIGLNSMPENTTGNENIALGWRALWKNEEGHSNVAVGVDALRNNDSGSSNVAIGDDSGPNSPYLSHSIAIGASARTTESFQVRIGNSSITSIGGQVGWTTLSDGRYKRNIKENVNGLDFILGLRPVTYNFDVNEIANKLGEDIQIDKNGNTRIEQPSSEMATARSERASKRQIGFIAQEVEELANNLGIDFSGVEVPENEESMYSLRYAEFVVPIVKAMQEQQVLIDKQGELIAELRRKINEIMNK